MNAFFRRALLVVALAGPGAAAVTAALAPAEQAMVDWLGGKQEEMVTLLERAVLIDSPSENIAGVKAVADLFAGELKTIGLEPRWVPLPAESKRAGHLFAERTGTKGKRLLLIGHLDTVLPGGKFTRDGDTGRGSGVNDIKGGNVVLVYALKALQAAGALDGTQVVVALTGDEESIGEPLDVSRKPLIDAGKQCDVALAFEGGIRGEATVARRGSSSWRLEVTAATGHSSGVFSASLGSGAIYEAARVLDGFHTELRKLPGLTANVALIAGGAEVTEAVFSSTASGKTNIIPARAVARGDLRALSPDQLAQAETTMRDVAAKHRPRAESALTFAHRYPPMASEPRHLAVLAVYDAASRDLGQGPVAANDPTQRGAGDAAFVAPYCGVLDGLGPYGVGAHAARESVELKSLVTQAARAAVLIYRLTR
ncbi:M20/M25/M40 family metallo-hydrolase [Horticoccus sp. 23ND18S-11]|uniref:M20/M25/M40 family metallo-hydrolase n=1 Tax=Horticoccus sp. 23ND18S-11 TaxID=3391832 RepID=UPI0039C8E2FD